MIVGQSRASPGAHVFGLPVRGIFDHGLDEADKRGVRRHHDGRVSTHRCIVPGGRQAFAPSVPRASRIASVVGTGAGRRGAGWACIFRHACRWGWLGQGRGRQRSNAYKIVTGRTPSEHSPGLVEVTAMAVACSGMQQTLSGAGGLLSEPSHTVGHWTRVVVGRSIGDAAGSSTRDAVSKSSSKSAIGLVRPACQSGTQR